MSIPNVTESLVIPEPLFVQLSQDEGVRFKMESTNHRDWQLSAATYFFQKAADVHGAPSTEKGTWKPKDSIKRIFIEEEGFKGELTTGQYEAILDIFNELRDAKSFTAIDQNLTIRFE